MASLKVLTDYGPAFQIKTIGALLTRKEFVQNIHDILSDEHFPNPAHKWIINEILQYWNKYHTVISMDTLKIGVKKLDNDVLKTSIVEQLKEAYRHSDDELQYVEEEFTAFCKNQQLKTALLSSVDLLNSGDYDNIRHLIDNALKAGQDRNIGHEYNKDIETRYREDYRPTIPTPWPMLNQLTQGGFGPGDLGIVFGNPGGGKCLDENAMIEIEYPEYGLELVNNQGKTYTLWIQPWEEFNIDGYHLYGWQVNNLFTNLKK